MWPGKRPREQGIVLILTVLVMSIVLLVGYAMSFSAGVNLRAARNAREQMQRDQAAQAALAYACALLARDASVTKNDNLAEPWAASDLAVTVGRDTYGLAIEDENRRLNVNRATRPPADPESTSDLRGVLKRLVRALNGADADYDALCAWTDAGIGAGAMMLRPVLLISELHAVPGLRPELWQATDSRPALDTVLGAYADRINVNTAAPEVVAALWTDQAAVRQLCQRRDAQPFANDDELGQFLGSLKLASYQLDKMPLLVTSSDYFLVHIRPPGRGAPEEWVALVQRTPATVAVLRVQKVRKENPGD